MTVSVVQKTRIGLGLTLAILLVIGIASDRTIVASRDNTRALLHAHETLNHLADALSALESIQAGCRGFALTGQEAFLASLRADQRRVADAEAALHVLLVGDGSQQRHLATLEQLTGLRIAHAEEIVRLRRAKGAGAAAAFVGEGHGVRLMNDTRTVIREMEREEDRVLAARNAEGLRRSRRARIILLVGMVLGSLVAVVGGVLVHAFGVRARAEEEFRQQRLLLESVFGSIRDGVIAADQHGRFLLFNAAAKQMLGVGATDGEPATWSDYYGVLQPDMVTPFPIDHLPLVRAMRGESTDDVPMLIRHARLPKDVWVNVSGRPLRDREGDLRGGVIIVSDMTSRRETENALRRSEERFRSLVESIKDDAMFLLDEEGHVATWNAGAERISGYAAEEIIGQHVSRLYAPDDVELGKPQEELAIAARTGRFEGESQRIRKDGSPYAAGVIMTSMHDPGGAIRGYATVSRDLSEGRRSESRFRALLESAPDAMVLVDPQGCIELANAQMESLFGYSRPELIGQSVDMLVPERFRSARGADQDGFFQSPERRGTGEEREPLGLRKDGTEFPVEFSLSPLEDPSGSSIMAAIRDITERKRAEQHLVQTIAELKRSNDELEQFAYVTSHDLQEPLRMVSSYTQLLAKRYKGRLDKDADDFIAFAVDGATRMRRLIQDLLAYSRAGTSEGRQCEMASEDALSEALVNLEGAMTDGAAVVTHGPLPTVTMNHSHLVQIFQNLIGNAIKYRGADAPRIHVTARSEHGQAHVFSVQDNGLGIEPQQFERIFIIFQRLHGRDAFSGTGIGLAICRKLVERRGGRIWVDSEPGHGSTFHFALLKGG